LRVTTTLGWWERERGEKQSTPSITSTADSYQPKRSRSARCSQSDMPQRKEGTSTPALPRGHGPAGHRGSNLPAGRGWKALEDARAQQGGSAVLGHNVTPEERV